MDVVPKYEFRKIVEQYKGDYRAQKLTCRDQFLCMCFGQLTFRDSLEWTPKTGHPVKHICLRVGV
ncbi:DUF4372 domain-containing protein [Natronogracilivirgula saccharolytica]|uniref:DUF4372 domain-containing protein n=2 Tax=Natronogracilivirga saccharolytica TaxID=2812953 RepID=A0A8J7UV00_9BACT|nr:DUF4372 domain-containing protein [Natronogracilivirga saccharolytica]